MANKEYNNNTVKNILITDFSTLGDVARAIPVVYPVCEANAQINFVFATHKEPATMFVNRPSNLIVLGVDTSRYNGLTGPLKLARNLQHRYSFDAVVNLQSSAFTRLMGFQFKRLNVNVFSIANGDKESKILNNARQSKPSPLLQESIKATFGSMRLTLGEEFISIYQHSELARSPLIPVKEDAHKWIGIAPFASHRGTTYPLEQMQLVIAEVSRWENCHIFLLGSTPEQRKALDNIMRRYSNVTSLPHIKHSTADELALMSQCDVIVTTDSAHMHMASLVNAPVVSVWGATHPLCGLMGWHQAMRDTVQLELECRPCSLTGNKKCRYGDYHCLRDISPELIINKVKKVLER